MTSVIPVQCFYPTALTSQLGAGQFVGTHIYDFHIFTENFEQDQSITLLLIFFLYCHHMSA